MPIRNMLTLAAVTTLAAATPVLSQDQSRGFIALGAGTAPEYLGSDDDQAIPFIFGSYTLPNAEIRLEGTTLSASFGAGRNGPGLSFGPSLTYRLGREDVENAAVAALPEIDPATELGGFVGYTSAGANQNGVLNLQLAFTADVSGTHDGFTVSPSITYSVRASDRLRLALGASVSYGDSSFNNTYFGVDAAGAVQSGLARFDIGSGFHSADVSMSASYDLSDRWSLNGRVVWTTLLGDAADCPIGSRDDGVLAGLAVGFRF